VAHEGLSLLVLVKTRGLSDEHQVGIRVPRAEHDLRSALREPALLAVGDLVEEGHELLPAGKGIGHGGPC
jgi:hypothetical protein